MCDHSLISVFHKCFPALTENQAKCAYLYAKGLSSAQIAKIIGTSRQNVDKHLHASAKKMSISLSNFRLSVPLDITLFMLQRLDKT